MDPVTVTCLAALGLAGFVCGLNLAFPAVGALAIGGFVWMCYWCLPWHPRHEDVRAAHLIIGLLALPFMLPMLGTALWVRMHVSWSFDVHHYETLRDYFLR